MRSAPPAVPDPGAVPDYPPRGPDQDDHAYIAEVLRLGPVVRDRYGILTTFTRAHMELLFDDRVTRQMELETMRMKRIGSGPIFDLFANALLFSNGGRHRARRTPLARTFAHPVMQALRPALRRRAADLIAPHLDGAPVDFVETVAGPLPAGVIAALLGVPEADVPHFTRLVYSAIRALSLRSDEVLEEAAADLAELNAYVEGLLDARRAAPGDDVLSGYLARVTECRLDALEIRMQIVLVILAGADTTRVALTSTLSQLLQHPGQWEALIADPDGVKAAAAAEGLRFDPVIGTLARVSTAEIDLGPVHLAPGQLVGISVLAALRDPAVYAAPDRFDIRRTDHPRWHPVFGAGPHRCLGEALARAEIEEALAALADLAPGTGLAGRPARLRGLGATRTVDPMPVRLRTRPA